MELLDCILAWKDGLSEKPHPQSESRSMWSAELGHWLAEQRREGLNVSPTPHVSEVDCNRLSELLHTLSLSNLHPRDILMVCLAGSRLYNLSVPTSDKDYIVVFRQSTQNLLSCVDQLSVSVWCTCVFVCGCACVGVLIILCGIGIQAQQRRAAGRRGRCL